VQLAGGRLPLRRKSSGRKLALDPETRLRNLVGSSILVVIGAASIVAGVLGLVGVLPRPALISVGAVFGGVGLIQLVRQVNRRDRERTQL
jgi:hypothetical protein